MAGRCFTAAGQSYATETTATSRIRYSFFIFYNVLRRSVAQNINTKENTWKLSNWRNGFSQQIRLKRQNYSSFSFLIKCSQMAMHILRIFYSSPPLWETTAYHLLNSRTHIKNSDIAFHEDLLPRICPRQNTASAFCSSKNVWDYANHLW